MNKSHIGKMAALACCAISLCSCSREYLADEYIKHPEKVNDLLAGLKADNAETWYSLAMLLDEGKLLSQNYHAMTTCLYRAQSLGSKQAAQWFRDEQPKFSKNAEMRRFMDRVVFDDYEFLKRASVALPSYKEPSEETELVDSTSLSDCLDMTIIPTEGLGYANAPRSLKVHKVIDYPRGLLVVAEDTKGTYRVPKIFVRTDYKYVDGEDLGICVCTYLGPVQYTDEKGNRETIRGFAMMEQKLGKSKIVAMLKKLEKEKEERLLAEKKAREERQRREAEEELERRRAAAEKKRDEALAQKEADKALLATSFAELDLDPSRYVLIPQELKDRIGPISIREKQWRQMAEAQTRKDWLGMLNLIPYKREWGDPKDADGTFKECPSADVINARLKFFKKQVFHLRIPFKEPTRYSYGLYDGYGLYAPVVQEADATTDNRHLDDSDLYLTQIAGNDYPSRMRENEHPAEWETRIRYAGANRRGRYDEVGQISSVSSNRLVVMSWRQKHDYDAERCRKLAKINNQEKDGTLSELEAVDARKALYGEFLKKFQEREPASAETRGSALFPYYYGDDALRWAPMEIYGMPNKARYIYVKSGKEIRVFGRTWTIGKTEKNEVEVVCEDGKKITYSK